MQRALKEVDEDNIVLELIRCTAAIEVLVHDKQYLERISKPIEFAVLSGKELHSFFVDNYQKFNGYIIDNKEWNHCVSIISEHIAQGKPMIIYGKTGVGKTSIMQSFGRILSILKNPNHQEFITKRAPDLVDEFKKGMDINMMYSKPLNTGLFKNAGLFIDDIGTEEMGNSYGNKSDVIGDLILAIYARHDMRDRVSFATNLSADKLKSRYGERVYGRLMEMCTVVVFPESIPNFRLNKA
jgi:DNA replication protein DnaC